MPKTSPAAKEGRRTQILNAAVRCFARRGYYETTIEDLVAETGLSRGALYLYFPSKEAIYLAISERWSCGLTWPSGTRSNMHVVYQPSANCCVLASRRVSSGQISGWKSRPAS